jgi:hypothetical protein
VEQAAGVVLCGGSATLVAALYVASLMYFWEPWTVLTLEWVKAGAKYAA